MSESSLIQRSEDVLGGTPVFSGTRVPIQTLFDYLEGGDTLDEFLDDFPSVSREHALNVLKRMKESFLAQEYESAA
ncbi:MAG TPA: DUF433 domain-containing protein [Pyrinomonadaceae bacterium]|jgi:uncharacterized protein (DUF433 family)